MKATTTRRADYIVSALTVLAVMPYENGPIAVIIPPHWKPYVAAAGVIVNIILREVKARQASSK